MNLICFFKASSDDIRIGPLHVSLYMALLYLEEKHGSAGEVRVFCHQVMPYAKLFSKDTYGRCIRELHEFGYIDYEPSFSPLLGSRVRLKGSRFQS
jgi:hypothetical protein